MVIFSQQELAKNPKDETWPVCADSSHPEARAENYNIPLPIYNIMWSHMKPHGAVPQSTLERKTAIGPSSHDLPKETILTKVHPKA